MLPAAALAQLQSIPALLSERYWTGSGAAGDDARRGVLLLFAGSTGTGKTLAAQVLAAEMGLPILSADLEAVYAGGRGEAARLMARLFANAQRLGAVLELDQADFILSSAVASERPLSIRVADADLRDLLERCESHPGVVVFPTTRTREIDEVVRASTDAAIEFPFPETPARVAIWRRSLSPGAAVSAAEIDDLAGSFQLPGPGDRHLLRRGRSGRPQRGCAGQPRPHRPRPRAGVRHAAGQRHDPRGARAPARTIGCAGRRGARQPTRGGRCPGARGPRQPTRPTRWPGCRGARQPTRATRCPGRRGARQPEVAGQRRGGGDGGGRGARACGAGTGGRGGGGRGGGRGGAGEPVGEAEAAVEAAAVETAAVETEPREAVAEAEPPAATAAEAEAAAATAGPEAAVVEAEPREAAAKAQPAAPAVEAQPAAAAAVEPEAEPVHPEEPTFAAALHAAQAPSANHEVGAAHAPEPDATPAVGPQSGDELAPPAHPPQAAAPEPPDLGDAAIDDAAADDLVRAMARSAAGTATARAPKSEPRRRRRWVIAARRLVPVALIGIVSAVVLGFVASNQRKPAATPAVADRVARTSEVSFRYPGAWQAQRAPTIPGLSLRDAVAVSSSTAAAGRLVIGVAPTQSDNPLPERFIAAAIPGTPTQQLVTLGKHQFFRVIDPRLTLGASSQSVYALSAAPRPVIAVCQTASRAFAASCEQVLSTLQLTRRASAPAARTTPAARPPRPQPNRAYARALSAILSRLNRDRSAAAHDLAAARTSKVEAKAAGLLAGLHAQASGEIAGLRAGSAAAANAGLATALRNLANAYGTLGRGALHNDPHGYRVGLSDIAKATSALSAALAKLAALGYAVR